MDHQSMKPDTEDAGRQPPEGPVFCKKGCGFFGAASTMYFCSLCYKEHVKEQGKEVASTPTDTEMVPEASTMAIAGDFLLKGDASSTADSAATTTADEGGDATAAVAAVAAAGSSEPQQTGKPGRCSSCNKRVGYTGFKCRCGQTFCTMHRHSDQHNCPVDYRSAAQAAIAKANPVIKADKLDRI